MTTPRQPAAGSLVIEATENAVTTITLNRPDRLNALNGALGDALLAALVRAAADGGVRAVILTGAGRGFCAGGDLQMLQAACERDDVREVEGLLATGKKIVLAIAEAPKPVLASVNGPAAGAGCNLALACDLRIAGDAATFAESFARVGLFPDFGGTYFLPRLVGHACASELMYTGDTVTAADAAGMGMVSRVVPQELLATEAVAMARRLASAPPLAARGIKRALLGEQREALVKALDEEIRQQLICFRSHDFREGLAAFAEKRQAHFRGE